MGEHLGLVPAPVFFLVVHTELQAARDRQDRAVLDKMIAGLQAKADKQPNDAQSQYQLALAQSFAAELAIEVRDKARGREMDEAGRMPAARAINLDGKTAQYRPMLRRS